MMIRRTQQGGLTRRILNGNCQFQTVMLFAFETPRRPASCPRDRRIPQQKQNKVGAIRLTLPNTPYGGQVEPASGHSKNRTVHQV